MLSVIQGGKSTTAGQVHVQVQVYAREWPDGWRPIIVIILGEKRFPLTCNNAFETEKIAVNEGAADLRDPTSQLSETVNEWIQMETGRKLTRRAFFDKLEGM